MCRRYYYFKKTAKSYFNVEYIKYLYLLQKVADTISEKINLYDEKKYMHEINIFIKMFIKLYYNSNIDCNKKIENKIYSLFQHYVY